MNLATRVSSEEGASACLASEAVLAGAGGRATDVEPVGVGHHRELHERESFEHLRKASAVRIG